jgi:hypothetical protein
VTAVSQNANSCCGELQSTAETQEPTIKSRIGGCQVLWGDHMHNNNEVLVYSSELARISDALISSGYTSLDDQAKALGLGRSTAWTITKNKHKLGRLSAKTINRILANPQTPPAVRAVLQEYVAKRYGRRKQRLTNSDRNPPARLAVNGGQEESG